MSLAEQLAIRTGIPAEQQNPASQFSMQTFPLLTLDPAGQNAILTGLRPDHFWTRESTETLCFKGKVGNRIPD